MCLAVPGQVERIHDSDELLRMADVNFAGVTQRVSLAYTPDAKPGDYVIVHVGFAISILDENEALRTLEYLRQIGELDAAAGDRP